MRNLRFNGAFTAIGEFLERFSPQRHKGTEKTIEIGGKGKRELIYFSLYCSSLSRCVSVLQMVNIIAPCEGNLGRNARWQITNRTRQLPAKEPLAHNFQCQ
jgi:hypothetical protein